MKKLISEKNTLILLFIFFAIQPLLDIYILFSDEVLSIFRFAPPTIIRMLFVAVFVIMLFTQRKFNFKKEKYILIYLALVVVYFVFHHFNALNFKADLPGNFIYSPTLEVFYFIRMLIPLTLIYIVYKQNFKKEYFYKIINIVSLAFSGTIVITNLFKLSLTAYGGNRLIADNIFGWFTETGRSYGHYLLSSKGLFTSANQISTLLLILLIITFYRMLKAPTKFNIFVVATQILSMIMLGTRAASYGWIAATVTVFIFYLFFTLIKKEFEFNKKIIFVVALLAISFSAIQIASPIMIREYHPEIDVPSVGEVVDINELREELNYHLENLDEENFVLTEEIVDFFERSYMHFGVNPVYMFTDLYSYKEDPVFWLNAMALPFETIAGNRNHDLLITNRIFELNDNRFDRIVGVGFSTLRSGVYLEQDFRVHGYSLGIVGTVLLLGPYLCLLLKAGFVVLINFKKKFNMENIVLMASIAVAIVSSWMSGHVMDELVVNIFIALISGMLLLNLKGDKDA